MSARRLRYRSAFRHRSTGSHIPVSGTATTEARIPDDHSVICSIVAAYLAAPNSQLTHFEMTENVIHLSRRRDTAAQAF